MANGNLYQWESTASLKHHCGFCDRPLGHPSAKISCFGTHAEPCARYHQGMHMRGRGHTCAACVGVEEAHHKRHVEIAELLRLILEKCGEDPYIGPSMSPGGRGKETGALDTRPPDDDTDESADTPLKKRDRKEAKRLAKAASRPKVITTEEIEYLDSVLHPPREIPDDPKDPANFEEVEEIERNIRFNAHVYNNGFKRKVVKSFAEVRDTEIDFELEMGRILDTFNLTPFIKRNEKNRGLVGKDLKVFEAQVEDFKQAVVEDLVLRKKDELETRMRRGGYLRYTNRASYEVLENRYRQRDWRTGDFLQQEDEESDEDIRDDCLERGKENVSQPRHTGPDMRHLTLGGKLLRSEGDSDAVFRDLYYAGPDNHRQKPQSKESFSTPNSDNTHRIVRITTPGQENGTSKKKADPPKKKADPFSVTPAISREAGPQEPSLKEVLEECGDDHVGHPAVSAKKAKKRAREAIRKAKKKKIQEEEAAQESQEDGTKDECTLIATEVSVQQHRATIVEATEIKSAEVVGRKTAKVKDTKTANSIENGTMEETIPKLGDVVDATTTEAMIGSQSLQMPSSCPPQSSDPSPRPVRSHGKFSDWKAFNDNLFLDAVTDPIVKYHFCVHDCPWRGRNIKDCPYHFELYCDHANPLNDVVYIIYPSTKEVLFYGPYNRLRAKRLLQSFNQDLATRSQLIIVDKVMKPYFTEYDMKNRNPPVAPQRLKDEYSRYAAGAPPGPLMLQEMDFCKMIRYNMTTKRGHDHLTAEKLAAVYDRIHPEGQETICYCDTPKPAKFVFDDKVHIECGYAKCPKPIFHRRCLTFWHVDEQARWYCEFCVLVMKKHSLPFTDPTVGGEVLSRLICDKHKGCIAHGEQAASKEG